MTTGDRRGTSASTKIDVVASGSNKLRIIGGQWRGRKLEFPAVAAIRPTPDRVRETLFNWLQDHIVGAHCLDLFAGSGALGFEALSRGAASVLFVERDPAIVRYLRDTSARLQASGAIVERADAEQFLAGLQSGATPSFNVVFLDPPFSERLLPAICQRLEDSERLAPNALIYMECAASDGVPTLPANWELIKRKTAGQVGYYLARRQ